MPSDRIHEAERRLTKVEALEQMLKSMQEELTAYRSALDQKLTWLQNHKNSTTPAPSPPARPVTKNTPTKASPTAHGVAVSAPTAQGTSTRQTERRSSPRRKGNPVPILLSNAGVSMDSFQGWVIDRSAGGLRILVDQQVSVGTIMSVRPAKAHGSFPWLEVEIRSCQPERSSYALGVKFVVKPAWSELQGFG
jgi:PilZ domain